MNRLIPPVEHRGRVCAASRATPPQSKHERPRIRVYLYPTVRNYINSLCRRCCVAVFISPVCFNVPFQAAHTDLHDRRALSSQRRHRKPTSKHALAGHTPLHRCKELFQTEIRPGGRPRSPALLEACLAFATLALINFNLFFVAFLQRHRTRERKA